MRVHLRLVQDPRIDAEALAVYLGIAVHAEVESGQARPSRATLAGYARVSERTVFDRIQLLEELGYIGVEHRAGKASIYRLLPPPELNHTPAGDAAVPRQEVHGSERDPGSPCETPRQQVHDTPAPPADELEPRTRTRNETLASPAAPTPPKQRQRDDLWDTLIDVCGLTGVAPTGSARGAWNRARRDLAAVGATPDEIRARAAAYRRRWPGASLTPTALARRWAECVAAGPSSTTSPGVGHTPPPPPDRLEQARGLGRNLARTDLPSDELDGHVPRDLAEGAAFREAFLEERARLESRRPA